MTTEVAQKNSNIRTPENQNLGQINADRSMKDRSAAPNTESMSATGNDTKIRSPDADTTSKASDYKSVTNQTFPGRDEPSKGDALTKNIDKDAPEDQKAPQTYDAGNKASDNKSQAGQTGSQY
jgi:hypothetical protein